MAEQVALDDALKKELLELEAKLETADHFALLGLPPGAEPAEVKAAYFELCRRIHPDRYFRKNLGSFKARMEKVFKALSKAHQTLTDPEKREAYLSTHQWLKKPAGPRRVAAKRVMLNKKDLELPLPTMGTAFKKDK